MIKTEVYINSQIISDIKDIRVNRSLSENNGASNFTMSLNNKFGQHKDSFNLNDDIKIYIDEGEGNYLLFGGVLENIDFGGEGTKEDLEISGRDYSAIMQDRLIQPIAYRDTEISQIVIDIMHNNVPEISTDNVKTTDTNIDRITFNHLNVFDAIKSLAETAGFYFFVSPNKELYFEQRGLNPSEETLDNTNIIEGSFRNNDHDIYNSVWVYGRRILTGYKDNFIGNGTGSVFTLTDKPHNTNVTINGSQIQPGGIEGMDNPQYDDIKYLVDFDKKQIIFTSGISAGNNIPPNNGSIIITYDRGTPILKYRQDNTSIQNYGLKTKLIVDKNIQSFEEASQKANTFLTENKDPIIEGNLKLNKIVNLNPGEGVTVNLPNFGINNQEYTIIESSYQFSPSSTYQEDILSVRLNKKVDKFEDTIKEIILNQKALETSELQGYLTNFQSSIGSIGVQTHYELWTSNATKTAFKFHVEGRNKFNSQKAVLGPWLVGSNLLISGGVY
jgi:prophage tail gpP-like protein